VTVDAVRNAVAELLDDPSYRRSADSVAGEIARMPHPDDVAPAIVASA
jgi:UDP:flavonoid glycosyltransferase YjiC (YdhE family)